MKPTPPCLSTEELVAEISWAEQGHLSTDAVIRCLDLLVEIVRDVAREGRAVHIKGLGVFSAQSYGRLSFEDSPGASPELAGELIRSASEKS